MLKKNCGIERDLTLKDVFISEVSKKNAVILHISSKLLIFLRQ